MCGSFSPAKIIHQAGNGANKGFFAPSSFTGLAAFVLTWYSKPTSVNLDDFSQAALERFVHVSKELLEQAFAEAMPYEEINIRLREFTLLQEALNRRNQMTARERGQEPPRFNP
jgi:hypothetical protein